MLPETKQEGLPTKAPFTGRSGILHLAGYRYWTASLFPAIAGTTLPFWLHPPDFSFKWIEAIAFLVATIFLHAGFSFLQAGFSQPAATRSKQSLQFYGALCLFLACLLGLYLNSNLTLQTGVPGYIFLLYGLVMLFVGALYVMPPFSFRRRLGGEIVLAESLGMLPVLGAYLVQVGDLTRTVYLASLPLIVVTGLWIWIDELASKADDEACGRRTLVIDFGLRFSGRYGVLALVISFVATLLLAVLSGSLSPLALLALLTIGHLWKIAKVCWSEYDSRERMLEVCRSTIGLHFLTGSIIAVSSLLAAKI